jgi:uncharacterized protein (UPF0332 family)
MNFDWSRYLVLAESLALAELPGGAEASLRSATSRAYYAAFATARRHSRERHGRVIRKTAAEHGEVAMFLALRGESGGVIAAHLARLRFLRNRADYDDDVESSGQIAEEAIARARRVLDLLATI